MKSGVVSIVIPIYNVEKYLERCLLSVVNQTYKNIEIILVDDGSTDNCYEICEKWKRKDNRIKVIHKENEGLGMARNTGIENATGEYICFFDSDDYVDIEIIEKTYTSAINNQADIVIFGYLNISKDGNIKNRIIPYIDKQLYINQEVVEYILPNIIAPDPRTGEKTYLWTSSCACLYSMNMIKNASWKFVSERQYIAEDVYSILTLYKYVKRVYVLSEALYCYCENERSLTHVYRKDRYKMLKYCFRSCQMVCREQGYNNDVRRRLLHLFMYNVIGALKTIVISGCSRNEKNKYISEIINDPYLQEVIHKITIKHEAFVKRILFEAIRNKQCWLVYILVNIKCILKK